MKESSATAAPASWKRYRFSDCLQLINGRAYGQSELLCSGDFKVVRIQNLNGGSNWYYSNLELPEEKYCHDGDLLFAWSATFGPYTWRGPKAIFHYHIWKVIPKPDILDDKFAYLLLHWVTAAIRSEAHGVAMLHFTKEAMEGYEILLPSLKDQNRIADRLQAKLAAVEEARQAAQAQLDDAGLLEEGIRDQAFKGLLADWPREQKLSDVCAISAGGTPSRGNPVYFHGNIPWVKTLDLNFGTVADTEEKITQDAFRSIRGELLPSGTVMVAMYGGVGTIGKSGILGLAACTNQAVCALQPRRDVLDSQFLHEWIRYVRPEWMKLAGGNRKDPNINKSIVEAMTLPLPSLAEQFKFRSRLCAQLAEARSVVDAAYRQLAEIELLPSRLLAQAFGPSAP